MDILEDLIVPYNEQIVGFAGEYPPGYRSR